MSRRTSRSVLASCLEERASIDLMCGLCCKLAPPGDWFLLGCAYQDHCLRQGDQALPVRSVCRERFFDVINLGRKATGGGGRKNSTSHRENRMRRYWRGNGPRPCEVSDVDRIDQATGNQAGRPQGHRAGRRSSPPGICFDDGEASACQKASRFF